MAKNGKLSYIREWKSVPEKTKYKIKRKTKISISTFDLFKKLLKPSLQNADPERGVMGNFRSLYTCRNILPLTLPRSPQTLIYLYLRP